MQIWAMLVFSRFTLGPWHPKFLLYCFQNPVCSWPGHHNLISTTLKLNRSLENLWNAVGEQQKCPNSMMCVFYQKCYLSHFVKIWYMSNSSQLIVIFSCVVGVVSNSHVCCLCTSSTFLNFQYPFKISVHCSKLNLTSTVLCIWHLWNSVAY